MSHNGAHSRNCSLQHLDGRRREAKLLKLFGNQLVTLVGGRPSIAQQVLIDQASRLRFRLMMEAEAGNNDPAQFMAWNSALQELLREIGLEAGPQKMPASAADFQWTEPQHVVAA